MCALSTNLAPLHHLDARCGVNYSLRVYSVIQTDQFSDWLHGLRDRTAAGLVTKRVIRMGAGNLGDVKNLGDGLSEARIFYGPGYRLYFTLRDGVVIILLCGGDKTSQDRDIERARLLMKEV